MKLKLDISVEINTDRSKKYCHSHKGFRDNVKCPYATVSPQYEWYCSIFQCVLFQKNTKSNWYVIRDKKCIDATEVIDEQHTS